MPFLLWSRIEADSTQFSAGLEVSAVGFGGVGPGLGVGVAHRHP
ncbi:hypothetical protein CVCC1112_2272 [Paenarthrobacter nicotinovorans]|nr:hypothetical protein CVCC1112_2272 [Paenarthrobacter nicotinovorans]